MPGTELGKAYVQIIPTANGITSSIEGVLDEPIKKAGASSGKKLGSAIATGLKAASAAVVAGTVALSAAITKGVADTAAYGDNIDKMSQKMGLSAEAYQEWDAIMQHSGTSIDSMQASMKTLANAVENGNGAFERLGITQEQIAGMNNEELFSATITALQNVDNETERTYLAGQLLGRGATELGALLNTSAEDTEAMRRRVHELGGVMSNEAVKAAAAYQDSMQDMQTAFSGLSRNMLSEFLPAMTTVMDGLTEIFAGNSETGLGMISAGVDGLVSNITEKMPMFVDVALGILEALATAIIENLPKLAEAAINIMLSLGQFLIEKLPTLVDVALEMLLTLAGALIENLPTLIPAIVDVVVTIATKLTEPEMLKQLIDAAIQLALAIMEGLLDALPQLVEAVIQIVVNLSQALIENAPVIFEAVGELLAGVFEAFSVVGTELLKPFAEAWEGIKQVFAPVGEFFSGIWAGIKQAFGAVTSWFENIFSEAWQAVKDVFSTGGEIFSGIKEGIESTFKTVVNAIIDGINTVIAVPFNAINGFLGTLRGVSILDFKPFSWIKTFGVPQIPKLAKGGIVDNPTLVEAGEGDSAEAIIPLDKLWREMRAMWSDAAYSGGRGLGSIGSMTVNVYPSEGMDEEKLAFRVMDLIQDAVDGEAAVFA